MQFCDVCLKDRDRTQVVWLDESPRPVNICDDCLLLEYETKANEAEWNGATEQTARRLVG